MSNNYTSYSDVQYMINYNSKQDKVLVLQFIQAHHSIASQKGFFPSAFPCSSTSASALTTSPKTPSVAFRSSTSLKAPTRWYMMGQSILSHMIGSASGVEEQDAQIRWIAESRD